MRIWRHREAGRSVSKMLGRLADVRTSAVLLLLLPPPPLLTPLTLQTLLC